MLFLLDFSQLKAVFTCCSLTWQTILAYKNGTDARLVNVVTNNKRKFMVDKMVFCNLPTGQHMSMGILSLPNKETAKVMTEEMVSSTKYIWVITLNMKDQFLNLLSNGNNTTMDLETATNWMDETFEIIDK